MVWYFSNSCCQSDGESGGSTPSTGCHSTMESPDSVTRVAPPTSTITKTNPETASSQSRIMRRCRSGGEIGSMGRDARCRGSGAQVSQARAAGQCGATSLSRPIAACAGTAEVYTPRRANICIPILALKLDNRLLRSEERLSAAAVRELDLHRYRVRAAVREPLKHLAAPGFSSGRGGTPHTQAELLCGRRDLRVRSRRNARLPGFLVVVHKTTFISASPCSGSPSTSISGSCAGCLPRISVLRIGTES